MLNRISGKIIESLAKSLAGDSLYMRILSKLQVQRMILKHRESLYHLEGVKILMPAGGWGFEPP